MVPGCLHVPCGARVPPHVPLPCLIHAVHQPHLSALPVKRTLKQPLLSPAPAGPALSRHHAPLPGLAASTWHPLNPPHSSPRGFQKPLIMLPRCFLVSKRITLCLQHTQALCVGVCSPAPHTSSLARLSPLSTLFQSPSAPLNLILSVQHQLPSVFACSVPSPPLAVCLRVIS